MVFQVILDKEYLRNAFDYITKLREYLELEMSKNTHFFEEGGNNSAYQAVYKVESSLYILLKNMRFLIDRL